MINKRNVFIWLICALLSIIGWSVGMYDALFVENLLLFSLSFALTIPFACITVFMGLNLLAFPLPYSIFGKNPKSPFPAVQPMRKFANSWGAIGRVRFSIPFVNWHIFNCGVGIEIGGFGRVFLPYASMSSVESLSFGRYKVFHAHSEVRSPIVVPKMVFEAMKSSMSV